MTEFKLGIFKLIKRELYHSTLARTIVYTIGHIMIAALCNVFITGAEISLATADAIVEPIINGVWYYLLDKTWSRKIYGH